MVKHTVIGGVDLVGTVDLKELVTAGKGPCVSIFLPTHRSGSQTLQDRVKLRSLIGHARSRLESSGRGEKEVKELLLPCRQLLDDGNFWKYPADGLALYSAPGYFRRFWVQLPLEEAIHVDESFRIRPLLPVLTGDSRFFILTISQNQVKLYEATRNSIAELSLGPIPANMAEVLENEEFHKQLQFKSLGRSTVQFFGVGAGGEVDKESVEEFLRAIDRGVVKLLGEDSRPLVLAGVAYYSPLYRAMTRYPNVIDDSIEGNTEHQHPIELHAQAWRLVEPVFEKTRHQALERIRETATEHVATVITDVVSSAMQGGVDSLMIAQGPPIWGKTNPATGLVEEFDEPVAGSEDLIERAISETVLNDGKIYSVRACDLPQTTVAALLRF